MWDIPGGFIDCGETAEEAAIREMLEETGLQVKVTQYFGSFSDSYGDGEEPTLNLCFLAEPCGGIMSPQSDVAELQWFLPSEMPRKMAFAHQYLVLQLWMDTLKPGVLS
jgi:8-oxo-dGTP diphosphatase